MWSRMKRFRRGGQDRIQGSFGSDNWDWGELICGWKGLCDGNDEDYGTFLYHYATDDCYVDTDFSMARDDQGSPTTRLDYSGNTDHLFLHRGGLYELLDSSVATYAMGLQGNSQCTSRI